MGKMCFFSEAAQDKSNSVQQQARLMLRASLKAWYHSVIL